MHMMFPATDHLSIAQRIRRGYFVFSFFHWTHGKRVPLSLWHSGQMQPENIQKISRKNWKHLSKTTHRQQQKSLATLEPLTKRRQFHNAHSHDTLFQAGTRGQGLSNGRHNVASNFCVIYFECKCRNWRSFACIYPTLIYMYACMKFSSFRQCTLRDPRLCRLACVHLISWRVYSDKYSFFPSLDYVFYYYYYYYCCCTCCSCTQFFSFFAQGLPLR